MSRRGPRDSRYWPYFAQLAEKQGMGDSRELQRKWWAHEKRRMRRRERREGRLEERSAWDCT